MDMKAEMTLDLENRHGHKTGGMNMKIKSLYFAASAAIAFVATSCVEENFKENKVGFTNDPSAVCFGVTSKSVESKTIYGEQDENKNWPLYWTAGDMIDIYCPQAEDVTSASYTVYSSVTVDEEGNVTTKPSDGSTHKGQINPSTDAYLKWGGSADPHDFFAAYPSGAVVSIDDNVVDGENVVRATFNVNYNQICTIPADVTSGNYVAEPDMSNAYMVAYKGNVSPSVDAVSLDFKPIMTTLVVKVTAPTWAQNTTGYATVTGISIVTEVNSSDADAGKFVYDITNSTLVQNEVSGGTKTTHTTFVGVKHGDNHFVDLKSGETLTLTAFLPPIPINSENPIKIKLHVAGSDFIAHLGKDAPTTRPTNEVFANVSIPPSQMRRIVLPSLPDPLPDRSNWITPLDDNIYVSQLSIPGTHDSATKNCTDAILNLSESGKCQQLTITEQLEMGIRFFDIRPSGSDLAIYHGAYACYAEDGSTTIKLSDVFEDFNKFLDENPGEFIITILRYEDERVGDNESEFNKAMQTFVATETYTKHALPDSKLSNGKALTVGDMRGSILSIMRPNQGSSPDWYFYGKNTTEAPVGMKFISGFPGSHATGTRQAYLKDSYVAYTDQWASRTDWIVYCQNYYEVCTVYNSDGLFGSNSPLLGATVNTSEEQAVANKLASVKTYIEHATAQANAESNVWVINHCSGYRGSNAIFSAYAHLASDLNPNINSYILNRETPGCLGIILLDFVGTRQFNGYNVYGDLLPQVIIDNNYKYRMKRKGE